MGVENVVFLDRAKVPSDPVSPKPVFNMAVAFGLALITGIAISILRELMEKPVRSAKDIQLDLQLPLLGTVGKLKPRKQRNKAKTKSAEGATSYEEENAKIVLPGTTEVI
ncbi:Capsular polysaccharide type 8 biosynthesis protein cap8A [compost metagenome]